MKFNTFEEFINEIKITLVAFQSNPNNMTPRLEIIFKGVFKLINDDEIMAAYKLVYDKHLLIRESSVMLFGLGIKLLKLGAL